MTAQDPKNPVNEGLAPQKIATGENGADQAEGGESKERQAFDIERAVEESKLQAEQYCPNDQALFDEKAERRQQGHGD